MGGGDRTKGSCSSLAFGYIGNRNGIDVLDFRGGSSCNFFSMNGNIRKIANLDGVKSFVAKNENDFKSAIEVLKKVEDGKEYYFATGNHASIVRKTEKGFEYLELQTNGENWFKKLTKQELKERFGCKKTHSISGIKVETSSVLIDANSLGGSDEFLDLLGYINTSRKTQMKGISGYAKWFF